MPESTFLYGAATSAHQVEGDNIHNDWWEWEKRTPGVTRSGKAAGHWHKYKEDFALAKSLGHTAHRLSIEWSRIEPLPGQWDTKAVSHYRDVLRELREQGLTSFVTLHHFTNPAWLAKQGGWVRANAVTRYVKYVRYVAQQLGEYVDFWITINEPIVYALQSYYRGLWPPAQKDTVAMMTVLWHLAAAHRKAYRILHSLHPKIPVGIAKHCVAYIPERKFHIDDQVVAAIEDWWFNHSFYQFTPRSHDFVGINYYFPRKNRVHLFPPSVRNIPTNGPTTDMDWPIDASGLTHVLKHMGRYKLPIYVTENGLADAADSRRADFIRSHLRAVESAQEAGIDVRGYLHWSLLDNFEWADGFTPRFGLVEVDYATQARKARPSAYVYKAIIEQASRL